MLHQLFGRKSLKKTASTHDFLYEKHTITSRKGNLILIRKLQKMVGT